MRTSILFPGAGRAVAIIFFSLFQFGLQAAPRPHFQITSLGTLPGGGDVLPVALNNHGEVVGRAQDSTGYFRAFLFRDGNMSQLPIPNAGAVFCINDAGEIVAQAIIDQQYRPFFITPGGVVDLDAQTGLNVWPAGLNNSGVIAGNIWRDFIPEAITWSNGV